MRHDFRLLIKKLLYPNSWSSEAFIKHLRQTGCSIGNNTWFTEPRTVFVDPGRRSFISIGNDCLITRNVSFVAHDYSWSMLIDSHHEFLPSGGGRITVGNNVFIGFNCIILKNVRIGNNVIIGAGSVVTADIPDNAIVAGNPAKVVSDMDSYYKKRKSLLVEEAKKHARFIFEEKGRMPEEEEMAWFSVVFNGKYDCADVLAKNAQTSQNAFERTEPMYESYSQFLKDTFG